jgi:hypothetical protein
MFTGLRDAVVACLLTYVYCLQSLTETLAPAAALDSGCTATQSITTLKLTHCTVCWTSSTHLAVAAAALESTPS